MGSRLFLLLALGNAMSSSFAAGVLDSATETAATSHVNASTSTAAAMTTSLADLKTYPLPRVHVQFICPDVHFLLPRSANGSFDVIQMFDDYYMTILPTLFNNSTSNNIINKNKLSRISMVRHSQRLSTMHDVSHNKWYYPRCNVTSPQVLLTLKTEGFAQYDDDDNSDATEEENEKDSTPRSKDYLFHDALMNRVTPESLQSYMESNVCPGMQIYRAVVEDPVSVVPSTFDSDFDPFLIHNTFLLCGGEDYVYYDEMEDGEVDSGFILFGMIVGVVMVSMIGGELQLLLCRPHPSPRGERRGNGVAAGTATAATVSPSSDANNHPNDHADETSTTSSSSSTRTRRTSRRQRRRDRRRRVDYALAPPSEVEMV